MSDKVKSYVDKKSIVIDADTVSVVDNPGDKHALLLHGYVLVEELDGGDIFKKIHDAIGTWLSLRNGK